ncbi:helix-turn-helix domain-containing protein [Streptomyces sp. BBFR109]|uniref:helix-turn-helix domain-containing protein n=1 Tax=Streptomyces sp. BBFR109 TaxID=3448172 RepID=UPI003F75A500
MRDLPDDDSWILKRRRDIGANVRRLREERKLTQEDVHLAARMSRFTLQRVETGEESKLSTLLRIARVLEVPLADLMRD